MVLVYGTKHFGREDCIERHDVCEQCGTYGKLESYDTATYFTLYMLPLIPLGRKRITDSCPNCKRHYEMSLRKYRKAMSEDLSRCQAAVKADPRDSAAATAALKAMVTYGRLETLASVAPRMAEQHSQSADVQRTVGLAYEYLGDDEKALAYMQQAVALQDTPENREALAENLVRRKIPAEAEALLYHLSETPDEQKRYLLYMVIHGYLDAGAHGDALRVLAAMETADERLLADEGHQALKAKAEKAQEEGKPISAGYLRTSGGARQVKSGTPMWVAGLLPYGIVAGLLAFYFSMAISRGRARPMWLVNGTPTAYTVDINGTSYRASPFGHEAIRVSEGSILITVLDSPIPMAVQEVSYRTPFWTRPFRSPTVVLNPDRAAFVVREETIYSDDAPGEGQEDPPPQIFAGDALYWFAGIDYEFTEFPDTIQLDSSANSARRQRVYNYAPESSEIHLSVLIDVVDEEDVEDVLRQSLVFDPDNTPLLRTYTAICMATAPEKLIELLTVGITLRPVRIEWHRSYQQTMEQQSPDHDLVAEYTKFLADNPAEPAFAYLLGRVTDDRSAARTFFLKSEQGDKPIGYGYHAVAHQKLCSGQFSAAVADAKKAMAVNPDPIFEHTLNRAQHGAGDFDTLLKTVRKLRKDNPLGTTLVADEIVYLILANQKKQARSIKAQYLKDITGETDAETLKDIDAYLASEIAYVKGDTKTYADYWKASEDPRWELHDALRRKDIARAVELTSTDETDWLDWLLVYSAGVKAGKAEQVAELLEKTIEQLKTGDRDNRLAAQMLEGDAALVRKELAELQILPENKRVLAVALGAGLPSVRKECFAIARTHNFDPAFPQHILAEIMR